MVDRYEVIVVEKSQLTDFRQLDEGTPAVEP